ncbi:MAG: NAD-dependent dehydratase, partial [Sciscionella sp.]|nr:NAD-dependent dehydratase [Sciscionella sp.]
CRCVQLATENPAERGEFRVFNQMTESFSVGALAELVAKLSPVPATIEQVENPRVEQPEHYYNVVHTALPSLGLQPHLLSDTLIQSMFGIADKFSDRVDMASMRPTVQWRKTSSKLRAD